MKETEKVSQQSQLLQSAKSAYDRLNYGLLETFCHELLLAKPRAALRERLYAHSYLARHAMHMGHSDEAITWLGRAKEEIEKQKDLLPLYLFLAAQLAHQRAHYQEAIFAIEKAQRKLIETNDTELANELKKEKALIWAKYGDLAKARDLGQTLSDEARFTKGQIEFIAKEYEKALSQFVMAEEMADNESALISAKESKAQALATLSHIDEAVQLLDECLLLRRDFNGDDNAATHIPMFIKGQLLTKAQAYTEAEETLTDCFELLVNHCLPTHPWMLALSFERSLCTYLSGHPRGALQELIKTLDGLQTIYGYEHPLVVKVLMTIAKVQLSLGNEHKAIPAAKDAFAASSSFLLPTHVMVAKCKELLQQCEGMSV